MTAQEAETLVREVLRENLGEPKSLLPLEARLKEDLDFDELDYIETAVLLEKKLADRNATTQWHGGFVPDLEVAGWLTIQDVILSALNLEAPEVTLVQSKT